MHNIYNSVYRVGNILAGSTSVSDRWLWCPELLSAVCLSDLHLRYTDCSIQNLCTFIDLDLSLTSTDNPSANSTFSNIDIQLVFIFITFNFFMAHSFFVNRSNFLCFGVSLKYNGVVLRFLFQSDIFYLLEANYYIYSFDTICVLSCFYYFITGFAWYITASFVS